MNFARVGWNSRKFRNWPNIYRFVRHRIRCTKHDIFDSYSLTNKVAAATPCLKLKFLSSHLTISWIEMKFSEFLCSKFMYYSCLFSVHGCCQKCHLFCSQFHIDENGKFPSNFKIASPPRIFFQNSWRFIDQKSLLANEINF